MKVLLVTSQLVEDRGDRYYCITNFFDIVRRFSYLGEIHICAGKYNGHNSHLKIEKDLSEYVKYGNVTFLNKSKGLFLTSETKNILSTEIQKVDLVINYGTSYELYKLARKYGKKFMSFVVSCNWDAYWNHGWKGKLVAPIKYLEARYVIGHADYVLYVSNRFLQKRYPASTVIQVGCSNVRIGSMDNSTLDKHIEYLKTTFSNVCNIATTGAVDVRYKGHEYVLRALYELKKQGRLNIHYYLLGGGDTSFLASLTKKYQIEEQVHFLGIVPHDEIFPVLDKMHIYIQPSLQEGLPRSMVEAMSRGLLCIGANTAAIPELIQPKYVTRRKSVTDICDILQFVNKDMLIEQALVNFEEAKKYQEEVINKRRNQFFDRIKLDMEK